MELVILQDVVASFSSNWLRVANTAGLNSVQIKDRFREQGFGEGAEELEVEGIDISPVGGASRIFFRRAANNTQAEVHKLGCVFLQTYPVPPLLQPIDANNALVNTGWHIPISTVNAAASGITVSDVQVNTAVGIAEPEEPEFITAGGTQYANPKRGRGRPPGSKNKPKQVPDWPNV